MAQKKTAKKTAAAAPKKTDKPAAKKAAQAPAAKTAAKPAAKAPAKAPVKAAAKSSITKAPAKKAAPATKVIKKSAGGDSSIGEQLRYCLENSQLSDQQLFANVARLLHDNLGYSALNFFRNVDGSGKGNTFELLGATGEDPGLLYYADEPGAGDSAVSSYRIKFAGHPTEPEVLDEGGALHPFYLPASAPEGEEPHPMNIKSIPEYKDAGLSILYMPFRARGDAERARGDAERARGDAERVTGFVAAVLVNPRPRYSKSDFEPASLIAALLHRNLLHFRLADESALSEQQLAQIRAEARQNANALEERVRVLEEQTGDQHKIRKELETKLATENQLRAERETELQRATAEAEELRKRAQDQSEEIKSLAARAAALEAEQSRKLAEQQSELSARFTSETETLKAGLAEREASLTQLQQKITELQERRSELETEALAENETLAAKVRETEDARAKLETRLNERDAEFQNVESQLKAAREEREQEISKLQAAHAAALAAAQAAADDRLRTRETELGEQIQRLSSAQADEGAERELLSEELEKSVAELKAARAEADELKKRADEFKRQVEQASEARSATETQLAEVRRTSAETERAKAEREAEIKRLEDQLAARIREVQELQRAGETVSKELHELKTNLGSRDAALQQEQSRSAAQEQRIAALEKDLAEKNKSLSEQSATYDQLLQEEAEKQKTLAADLTKARSTIEQKETDYHNSLYELKQKVNTLTETLQRSRADAQSNEANLQKKVTELETAARELESRHTRQLAEKATQLKDTEEKLSAAEANIERLSRDLEKEQTAVRDGVQATEAIRREVTALQTQIAGLKENHARELSRLADAAKSREAEITRDLTARESALNAARQTVETQTNRIEVLQRDLARVREEKVQLNNKLTEAGRTEQRLRGEIETGAQAATRLNATLETAQKNNEQVKQERDAALEEGARLRQDIGIRREREARLEQAIAELKENIHALNNRLSEGQQKQRELDQNISGLRTSLSSTKAELSEQYQKERKLNEELSAALAREKGSEEEGRLLANLTNAISNLPDLGDKIRYLRENVPGRADIERVVVYRLADENTLFFEDGFFGEQRLDALRGQRVAVQETTFGQALVSLKPHRLETDAKFKNPDLPGALVDLIATPSGDGQSAKQNEMRGFLCLPLMQAQAGIGILVLASSNADAFDDKRVRILGNVAPLFAVAVQYERNNTELKLHRARIHNFQQVTQYQERRYLQTANQLHSLSTRILPVLQQVGGEEAGETQSAVALPADLLRDVNDFSQLPLPGSIENAVDFMQWIDTLGSRISNANLVFENELSVDLLRRLADRIGNGFQNLYWLVAEAFENVARHSQATRLSVELVEETNGQFRFSIVDNGEGLVRTAGTNKPAHGTGLRAISNLAEAAGGHAAFARDANGHGLAIHVAWDRDENDLDATLRGAREFPAGA